MGTRVTVYDIAKECGISASTISRVLNDSIRVKDERRQLVLETAARLGYRKRTIRKHESRAILNIKLVLPVTRNPFVHMFYDVAELVAGVQRGFGEVRVNIIVRLNGGENEVFSKHKLNDIHGCVFAFTEPDRKVMEQIESRKIATILLNRELDGLSHVQYDEAACMTALLERLMKKRQNSRGAILRPCFVGYTQVPYINNARKEGLAKGCRRFGLDFDPRRDAFDFPTTREITPEFLSDLKGRGYDCILCLNDLVAMTVYLAGSAGGMRFPEDFSLTGFDDSPAQELLPQRIDTIRFSVEQLGLEAGIWLKERIIERSDTMLRKDLVGEYVPGGTI